MCHSDIVMMVIVNIYFLLLLLLLLLLPMPALKVDVGRTLESVCLFVCSI